MVKGTGGLMAPPIFQNRQISESIMFRWKLFAAFGKDKGFEFLPENLLTCPPPFSTGTRCPLHRRFQVS